MLFSRDMRLNPCKVKLKRTLENLEEQWQGARWDRKLWPGVPDGRGGRGWQVTGGHMAVVGSGGAGGPDGRVVGQEADGNESDGAWAVGQGGPDSQEGGMGGCMRTRWQLLG